MVAIPLDYVLIFMPEPPLDMIQVNPIFEKPDRKGEPEVVKSQVSNVGFSPCTLKEDGQVKCPGRKFRPYTNSSLNEWSHSSSWPVADNQPNST